MSVPDNEGDRMNFFAELKRRNVIRMAGLYLVDACLVLRVRPFYNYETLPNK